MKKILLLFSIQLIAWQAMAQVSGTVQDENNQAMIGVSVLVIGTNTGTITDLDGHFEVKANVGDSLAFSFVGYEPAKILISGANVQIQMKPTSVLLENVVVMGYSTKARTEISSAVAVLSEKELNDTPTSDVATLLQGKVSGVQVVNSSGEPGSGAQVRIRGVSTIKPGNAEPLYVVDGIIGGAFDPNDVASLTVLKDAGATGMYGARANKGVIIVTTKKAKLGKPKFEFQTSYGQNRADHGNVKMMTGKQFFEDFSAELYRDYETHEIDKIKFYQDYPQELRDKNTSWVNELFQPAAIQKYYLSASGRSEKFGYYLSGTYYDEGGTFKKTGFNRVNLRANTDFKLSDRITLKNNINMSSAKGASYDYLDLYYAYLGVPWDNPYNDDGSPRYVDATDRDWWSRDHINPLHSIENSDYNYKGVDINYDLVLDVSIFDWLSFSSSNRLNFATNKNHRFVSPIAAGTFHGKGYIYESQDLWYGSISTNLFRFDKSFGDHEVDGIIGGEFERGENEDLSLEGKGLPEGFDVPTVASKEFGINGSREDGAFRSFISQVNYNFDKTYFLTASYRIDASSNFPSSNRIAQFPSISASWLMNKTAFIEGSKLFSSLKLRSSFGLTGDPDIGASRYLGLYSLNTQYGGNPAATPYQLANPELTWEKTRQFNFGIDLGMLNDRVNVGVDLYNNTTTDLIVLVSQPLSQGFEFRWENSGSVINKGVELNLSTMNIQTRNFEWTTDFNFATNDNKLKDIARPFYTTVGGISQIYENDKEIYTFILPKWLGIDPETGGPLWEKIERDQNGNITSRMPTPNYSEAEPQRVGKALPDFSGGLSTSLRYKNISLFASFAYQYGNDIYNFTRVFMDNDGHEPYYNNMVPKSDWSRWEKPGDQATHPSFQNNGLSKEVSSRYLEDGSFIKLRTLSLNYDLSGPWIERMHMRGMTIGLSANNLFTWTNFWGQDPEVTLNQLAWSMPGVSDFKYPNNKKILVNLSFKF